MSDEGSMAGTAPGASESPRTVDSAQPGPRVFNPPRACAKYSHPTVGAVIKSLCEPAVARLARRSTHVASAASASTRAQPGQEALAEDTGAPHGALSTLAAIPSLSCSLRLRPVGPQPCVHPSACSAPAATQLASLPVPGLVPHAWTNLAANPLFAPELPLGLPSAAHQPTATVPEPHAACMDAAGAPQPRVSPLPPVSELPRPQADTNEPSGLQQGPKSPILSAEHLATALRALQLRAGPCGMPEEEQLPHPRARQLAPSSMEGPATAGPEQSPAIVPFEGACTGPY